MASTAEETHEEVDPLRANVVPYLVGLIVPVVALVVGLLLGYLKPRDALAGVLIVLIVVVLSVGSTHLYLVRSQKRYESLVEKARADQNEILRTSMNQHDLATAAESSRLVELTLEFRREIFRLLSRVANVSAENGAHAGASIAVIDEDRMINIEKNSQEVWIYAFDLKWDSEDNTMAGLINGGLGRGRRYKVLLPPREEVRSRAKALARRNRGVPELKSLLRFRARVSEQAFQQFVINIYHAAPFETGVGLEVNEPVVVLQPRWDVGHGQRIPMLLINGQSAIEYEREFQDAWDEASAISMSDLIREPIDG